MNDTLFRCYKKSSYENNSFDDDQPGRSSCLNSQMGVSFPTFIARYRVAYAQNLMRREPEKLLSDIAEEAGFSNEANFFRTFKQVTGKTPSEWRESKI